jgi:hypothetical protein
VGLLAGYTGYPAVFLLTAALAATAVLPAWRERAGPASVDARGSAAAWRWRFPGATWGKTLDSVGRK